MILFQMRRLALGGLLVALLGQTTGCAVNESFKRGTELAAIEDWEAAIASYRQASQAEPSNLEFRATLTRVRAQAVAALLKQAADLQVSQPNVARDFYTRTLALDPRNERALAGFRAIETSERLADLYREAVRARAGGREREARQKIKQLLDEVPHHARARQLLRSMEERTGRGNQSPVLDASFQKPITLEFREAPVRAVFDVLARASGINFIFDRDLRQDAKVTIFVRNVNLDEALEQIAMANGLARRTVNNNTLLIYPAQTQKIREYQDLVVHSFFLEYADAKQINNLFRTVLKTRDVFVDEKRNLVVLRDSPEVVAMAIKLVAAHDQPEPEVMLEVEILEVKHSTLNELGIKFPDQISFGVASPSSVNAVRGANGDTVQVSGLDKALILNLKRQVGSTNLLANPRIRVRNKERAKIHIGDRVPVITSTISSVAALTTESVSYLDVGIKLEVEPSIQMSDVVIKVSLEVSAVVNTIKTNSGSTVYQLGTRNAATTLTLRDGETQVLAGLLQKSERGNSSRLPGLGDIPFFGKLFSSESLDGDKTEVLLSITPRITRNLERPSDDLVEFIAGPEASRQGGAAQSIALPAVTGLLPVRAEGADANVAPPAGVRQSPSASSMVPLPGDLDIAPGVTSPAALPTLPQVNSPPGVGVMR